MRPFRLFLLTTLLVPALLRAEGVTVRVCEGSCRVFLSPERPALRAAVSAAEPAAGVRRLAIRPDAGRPVCVFDQP